jgi:hypothetical protein
MRSDTPRSRRCGESFGRMRLSICIGRKSQIQSGEKSSLASDVLSAGINGEVKDELRGAAAEAV